MLEWYKFNLLFEMTSEQRGILRRYRAQLVMPAPHRRAIKQWCYLTSDVWRRPLRTSWIFTAPTATGSKARWATQEMRKACMGWSWVAVCGVLGRGHIVAASRLQLVLVYDITVRPGPRCCSEYGPQRLKIRHLYIGCRQSAWRLVIALGEV